MKNILLIVFLFLLFGCSNSDDTQPETLQRKFIISEAIGFLDINNIQVIRERDSEFIYFIDVENREVPVQSGDIITVYYLTFPLAKTDVIKWYFNDNPNQINTISTTVTSPVDWHIHATINVP